MKIIIHGLAMRKRGGGSRHLEGFIQALGQLDNGNEYLVCLNREFDFASPHPNIRVHPVEIKSPLHRLWWDQVTLPRLVRSRQADVVVSLFIFGMFWPPVPQIMFQRNPQFYCPAYLNRLRGRAASEVALRRWMAFLTMRASRLIVTPSQAMQDMIRGFHPSLPQDHFRVLPHGFDRAQLARQPVPEALAQQVARVGNRPLILYISHLEPHKAHDVAVQAMRVLKAQGQPACLCVTMDRRDWAEGYDRLVNQIHAWNLEDWVINLGRVPEGALDELYRRATIFFFPSVCESFGFPLAEALGYGLPIVAADTAINREMCGQAGLYYSSLDSRAAAQQLATLLNSPDCLAQARLDSLRQFPQSHLTWPDYARRFVEMLQEAALYAD